MTKQEFSAKKFGVLLMAFFGVAALAQATPIMSFDTAMAATTQQTMSVTRNTAAVAPATAAKTKPIITSASTTNASWCEIAGTCRSTLKVPEPQSLVMFGTGLLSMAGMIRRKLLR